MRTISEDPLAMLSPFATFQKFKELPTILKLNSKLNYA
jgi:hypothetical protein